MTRPLRTKSWQPTYEQLLCRDLRHSWSPYTVGKEEWGYVRVLVCDRCGGKKTQTLDKSGYILTTRMHYAPGYLRPTGGRMSADEQAELRLGNHLS